MRYRVQTDFPTEIVLQSGIDTSGENEPECEYEEIRGEAEAPTVLKGFLPVKRKDTPIATLCAGKLVEPFLSLYRGKLSCTVRTFSKGAGFIFGSGTGYGLACDQYCAQIWKRLDRLYLESGIFPGAGEIFEIFTSARYLKCTSGRGCNTDDHACNARKVGSDQYPALVSWIYLPAIAVYVICDNTVSADKFHRQYQ